MSQPTQLNEVCGKSCVRHSWLHFEYGLSNRSRKLSPRSKSNINWTWRLGFPMQYSGSYTQMWSWGVFKRDQKHCGAYTCEIFLLTIMEAIDNRGQWSSVEHCNVTGYIIRCPLSHRNISDDRCGYIESSVFRKPWVCPSASLVLNFDTSTRECDITFPSKECYKVNSSYPVIRLQARGIYNCSHELSSIGLGILRPRPYQQLS